MKRSPTISRIAISLPLAMVLIALVLSPLQAATRFNERATASISGEVYVDSNLNATREPLENGIAGSTVRLYDANGRLVIETTSDADGYYTFGNLEIAKYQLRVSPPNGFIVTENANVVIDMGEASAPALISTSMRFGVFVPFVAR